MNLRLFCALIAAASAADASSALGEYASGDAFPLESRNIPQLSRLVFEMGTCGNMQRSHWHDPSGMIVAAEELETDDSGLVRYRYWRPNVDESGVVTRVGDTLKFEVDQAGVKQQKEITMPDDATIGPMMTILTQSKISTLKEGGKVPLRYIAAGHMAAYKYTLVRAIPASTSDAPEDSTRLGVTVTPQSWVVRQFSRSLTMYFDADGHFEGLRGATLPVMGTAGRNVPLDLDAVVNRRYSRPCSPAPVSGPHELTE